MPITSLIIRTQAELTEQVSQELNALPGVSVTDVQKESLVTLTETEDQKADRALWQQIERLEGVAALDIIYHNFEDLED